MRPEADNEVSKKMCLPSAATAELSAAGETAEKTRSAKQTTGTRIIGGIAQVLMQPEDILEAAQKRRLGPLQYHDDSRLAAGIAGRPVDHALARFEEMSDIGKQPHGTYQSEGTDVGVR